MTGRFSPGTEDGTVELWSSSTGTLLARSRGRSGANAKPAFSPNGERIAIADGAGPVRVMSLAAAAQMADLGCQIKQARFTTDAARVLTACFSAPRRMWNVADGRMLATFAGEPAPNDIVFSPDDRFAVLTNEDGTARIFDAATGAAVAALIGHAKAVGRALYSRDGQHVATASWDNTAIVRQRTSTTRATVGLRSASKRWRQVARTRLNFAVSAR